jgi:hypothetical protein
LVVVQWCEPWVGTHGREWGGIEKKQQMRRRVDEGGGGTNTKDNVMFGIVDDICSQIKLSIKIKIN